MLKVLIERLKPTPRWRPYIDLLPRNFSYHPACFPFEDLSMLQGSPAYFRVLDNSISKLTTYMALYRHFRENPTLRKTWYWPMSVKNNVSVSNTSLKLETFTFDAYEWAAMVPMTRAYWTNTHGAAVIPLFDMQNHASAKEAVKTLDGNGYNIPDNVHFCSTYCIDRWVYLQKHYIKKWFHCYC